nr:MAG TPA: hypothetical protein [Caudoviricetes sp.]
MSSFMKSTSRPHGRFFLRLARGYNPYWQGLHRYLLHICLLNRRFFCACEISKINSFNNQKYSKI